MPALKSSWWNMFAIQLGEGIEKKEEDFAAEVAATLGSIITHNCDQISVRAH